MLGPLPCIGRHKTCVLHCVCRRRDDPAAPTTLLCVETTSNLARCWVRAASGACAWRCTRRGASCAPSRRCPSRTSSRTSRRGHMLRKALSWFAVHAALSYSCLQRACSATGGCGNQVLRKTCVQVEHILAEKATLEQVDNPGFVKLYGSFQDDECIYLAMEFVPGGEFFSHLKARKRCADTHSICCSGMHSEVVRHGDVGDVATQHETQHSTLLECACCLMLTWQAHRRRSEVLCRGSAASLRVLARPEHHLQRSEGTVPAHCVCLVCT